MAIPLGELNLVGCLASAITDLGLQATLGSAVSVTSNTNFQAPVPMTALVLAQLSSGQATVKVSVHSGTPNFGSPTASLSLSGTVAQFAAVNTTSSNPYVSLQQVDANWSSAFAQLAVVGIGLVPPGQSGVFTIQSGLMSCASTNAGPGTGVVSLAPQ